MRLPWQSKAAPAPEAKSTDVLPEWVWQALQTAQDLQGSGNLDTAVGLPAVLSVIRLLSHAAGMVPFRVVRGMEGELRQPAQGTWQHHLLYKRPGPPPTTPFNFKADLAAQFAGRGNAYIRKLKPATARTRLSTGQTPRVTELMVMDGGKITPRRSDSGSVVFDDGSGVKNIERGTDEVIHIRSFATSGGLEGVSPITACRTMIEAGLSRQDFERAHLRNGIFPGVGITFPTSVDQAQGERWLEFIEKQHKGPTRAGKTIIVGGGAELTAIPISLQDAQFAEVTRLTILQAATLFQVPPRLLLDNASGGSTRDADADWRHLLTFALGPFFIAAEQGFAADDDLFVPGEDDDLTPLADPDALLKLNPEVQANVDHLSIQDGVQLVDEVRARKGLGPLPPVPDDWAKEPGKVPQITPVGGAPNPLADTSKPLNDGATPPDPTP